MKKTVSIVVVATLAVLAQTSPSTDLFYTLTDLNNRLKDGTAGTPAPFTEPTTAPGDFSGVSINTVMENAPAVHESAAIASQVLSGRYFWSLDDSGWGLKQGTMTVNAPLAITPSVTAQAIPAGYYAAAGTVTGDASLKSENIKSGATIFGVAGKSTVVETESGNAVAADLLAGKKAFVKGSEVTGTLKRITYKVNGGYNHEDNPAWFTSTDVVLADPSKANSRFLGWYTDPGFTPPAVTTISAGTATDVTLYAKWEISGYTVTMDPNGGTLPNADKQKQIIYGDIYGILPTPTTIDLFLGWVDNMGKKITADSVVSIASDHTLLAQWSGEMVTIPGGTFLYQGTEEKTVSSFQMSKNEITQGQYLAVMGVNPSHHKGDDRLPVERVTWFDAVLFCNALSKAEGKDTVYTYTSMSGTYGSGTNDLVDLVIDSSKNGYYLPTDVQWEYAVRGGTTTTYFWGDNLDEAGTYSWYVGNSNGIIHPIREKQPNPFGLYDMTGNVWEWVESWNPSQVGLYRFIRGGNHLFYADGFNSDLHWDLPPDKGEDALGFRVVLLGR